MAQSAVHEISQRELLSFFFKYRSRLILAFALPFLLAVIVSFIPTPKYEASSVLVIRLGSEFVYRPEIGNTQNGQAVNIPFDRDLIFKSEVAILSSSDLHRQTVEAIGVDKLYPELMRPGLIATITGPVKLLIATTLEALGIKKRASAVDAEQGRLAVATTIFGNSFGILLEKESAVIHISFEHKDPALAQLTLKKLLDLYLEKRRGLYLESRVSLAQTQLEAALDRVSKAEQGVEEFKRRNQIYSFADQRAALLKQRSDTEEQIGTLRSRQAELTSLLKNLGREPRSNSAAVLYDRGAVDPVMANARIRMIDAESRLKDALAHYTKDSAVVAAARKQLQDAQAVLRQSEMDLGRAESERGSTQVRLDSLQESIVANNQKLDQLDALERDFNALVRDAKLAEDDYTIYSHQLDEAKAFENLQRDRVGSVRVIQPPMLPTEAKKIGSLIVLIGLMLSLVSMLLVAALTEFLRSGFYTPERLERTIGLPVLASIPYLD